jgi:hypothetical protein
MTLPRERLNSIKAAREFLRDLLIPNKTPKISKALRTRAYYILKHFPSDLDMERPNEAFYEDFNIKGKK